MKITYIPLERATAPPESGVYKVIAGDWWAHIPNKGLILAGPQGKSPQCNMNEQLAKKVHAKYWPDAETIQVERVFLPHDCGDYV